MTENLARRLGFVTTHEAFLATEKAAKKAAHDAKVETIEFLFLGRRSQYGRHSFFTDKTLVTAWNQKNGEAKLAWRVIKELLKNLQGLGAEVIGFDPQNGPETVNFDPEQHYIYNRSSLTNPTEDEIEKHDKEMSLLKGKKARVIIPGIKVEGEVIYYPRVEFIEGE